MRYNVHGTQIQIGDGASPEVFTTVAQVECITLPSETRSVEQVPTHDVAAGGFVPQLVDALRTPGSMTFTIIEDLALGTHDDATGLLSLLATADATNFKVILADAAATEIDFSGWVTSRQPQAMPSNRGAARVDYEITLEAGLTVT